MARRLSSIDARRLFPFIERIFADAGYQGNIAMYAAARERLQLQIDQATTCRRLAPGIQVDQRNLRTGIDPLQRCAGGREVRSAGENQQVQVGCELGGVEIG